MIEMKPNKKTVVIEVLGGVAYVKNKPKGIRVMIIDYDNKQG